MVFIGMGQNHLDVALCDVRQPRNGQPCLKPLALIDQATTRSRNRA
jgi:hypothetical protein